MEDPQLTVSPSTHEVLVLRQRRKTALIRRVSWLLYKLMFLGWAISIMLVPPIPVIEIQTATFHYIWTSLVALGSIVSSVGICVSMTLNPHLIRRVAVPLELSGLTLMIIGPGIYFLTQLNLLLSDLPDSFQTRFALNWFVLIVFTSVVARICMVAPRFHREK